MISNITCENHVSSQEKIYKFELTLVGIDNFIFTSKAKAMYLDVLWCYYE